MSEHHTAEALDALAAECRRIAETIVDRQIKLTYLEMARSWDDLARLRRTIDAEKQGKWHG